MTLNNCTSSNIASMAGLMSMYDSIKPRDVSTPSVSAVLAMREPTLLYSPDITEVRVRDLLRQLADAHPMDGYRFMGMRIQPSRFMPESTLVFFDTALLEFRLPDWTPLEKWIDPPGYLDNPFPIYSPLNLIEWQEGKRQSPYRSKRRRDGHIHRQRRPVRRVIVDGRFPPARFFFP